MTESLLSRFDSLALTENDLVVIVGLEFSRQHNCEPARVLDSSGERLKVQLLLVVDLVSKSHWAYHLLHLGVPAVLEVALS